MEGGEADMERARTVSSGRASEGANEEEDTGERMAWPSRASCLSSWMVWGDARPTA